MMLLHHLKQSLIRLLVLRVIFLTKQNIPRNQLITKLNSLSGKKNPNTKSRLCKNKKTVFGGFPCRLHFLETKIRTKNIRLYDPLL